MWTYSSKIYSGEMTMIIRNDRWTLFKSEYEIDLEIIKSKVDVLVENKFIRRCIYFIRTGN